MSSAPRDAPLRAATSGVDRLAGLAAFGLPMADGGQRGWALAAVVEGFGAVVWWGWAQVSAPTWLSTLLTLGSLAGFVLAVTGFVLAVRTVPSESHVVPPGVRTRYLVVLVAEAVVLVVGVLVLALFGLLRWSPVWVLAVFALHLPAVARVVGNRLLAGCGPALVVVAVLALVVVAAGPAQPPTVTGALAGLALFAAGVVSLVHVRRGRDAASPDGW